MWRSFILSHSLIGRDQQQNLAPIKIVLLYLELSGPWTSSRELALFQIQIPSDNESLSPLAISDCSEGEQPD